MFKLKVLSRLFFVVSVLSLCSLLPGLAQTDLPLEEISIEKGGSISPVLPPTAQPLSTYNLLKNGSFEKWTANEEPQDWSVITPGGSAAKVAAASVGSEALELTASANSDTVLHQTILATISDSQNSWAKGRTFTLGAWVKTNEPSKAVLTINDGIAATTSSAHSGSGNYEWLSVTKTLDSNAKELSVELNLPSSNISTAATFDGVTLVEAPGSFAFSPNSQDILGPITIDGNEVNIDGTLQTENLKILSGAREGYVLTSDVNGLGTWQPVDSVNNSKSGSLNLTLNGEDEPGEILKLPLDKNGGGISGIGGSGTTNYLAKFLDPSNLTVSLLYDNGANVGIGTTTPSQKLEVGGTIYSTSGGFKFPDGTLQTTAASGGSSQWATSGTNIYNANTGNVGIGKVPDAIYKLDVDGKVRIKVPNGNYGFGISNETDSTVTINSRGAGVMQIATDVSGRELRLGGGAFEDAVTIKSGGNVGIGTTIPNQKLQVVETTSATGNATGIGIWQQGSGDATLNFRIPGVVEYGLGIDRSDSNKFKISDFSFVGDYGTKDRLVIDTSGNAGIGTTTPSQKLEVAGTVYSTLGGFKFPDGTLQTTASLASSSPWATSGANIYNTNTGAVGIGTQSPQDVLHIRNIPGYSPALRFTDSNNQDTQVGRANFTWNGLTNPLIIQHLAGSGVNDMAFTPVTNSPTQGIVLKGSTGNIGIGTTSPSQKLEVAGTISSTSGGFKFPDATTQTTAAINSPSLWSTNGANIYNSNSGNVGIGTSTPTAKLNVNGDIVIPTGKKIGITDNLNSEIITYGDQAPFNTPGMLFTAHPTRGFIFGNYDGTTWTERMRISGGNGEVGVGTTSPQSRLQVSNGYMQIPFTGGGPSATDCDNDSEGGRMSVSSSGSDSFLWICRGSLGWKGIVLTP